MDSGYGDEPYRTLVEQAPDSTAFPPKDFRLEWGPIFHRGRLDGTARVLVIGQDPAQHEAIVRRVLVGEAGHRVQGFLAKLGIDRSYVIVNCFLYSAYSQLRAAPRVNEPAILHYRNQWFDALTASGQIEGVIAFGNLADRAWRAWRKTSAGTRFVGAYRKAIHPTAPRTTADLEGMLRNWNAALKALQKGLKNPDVVRPMVPYGTRFAAEDLVAIPDFDVPAGTPVWMRTARAWAARTGVTPRAKRGTITVTVPEEHLP